MNRPVPLWGAAVVLLFIVITALSVSGGPTMQLTSSGFQDGGKIPLKYVMPGAGGQNVSAPLTWADIPSGTKSLALSVVDPHPVANNWVHWMVIDIPASVTSLAEGASTKSMPPGAVELKNSYGEVGYGGPQPPKGTGDHPYVFTLYALSVPKVDLPRGARLADFKKAVEPKTLGTATLTGYYGR